MSQGSDSLEATLIDIIARLRQGRFHPSAFIPHPFPGYRRRNRRSQARAAIPEAWRELVQKGDEQLVELLASAVESKASVRADDDDVAEFLAPYIHQFAANCSNHPQNPLTEFTKV
jgi:hypothetical protein